MSNETPYSINLDIKFKPQELIDIQALVDACKVEWYNQTLCQVNDCVVRLGILHGEFHWHKHDREDEFFFVVEGLLWIDLEGLSVGLSPRQGFSVARGLLHRTRAPEKTVVLMIEGAGIQPTGN